MSIDRLIVILLCFGQAVWAFQNRVDGEQRQGATLSLRLAGIALDDEAALVKALHRAPLALSAAIALSKLPKTELIVRELNIAVLSDDEFLMTAAASALAGFGEVGWLTPVRARLPGLRNKFIRLQSSALLARGGIYDGWDVVESTIMNEEPVYRDVALTELDLFWGRKDAFGHQIDLIQKLEEMRSRASSEAVRDALAAQIAAMKRTQPRHNPPL